jgi:hypothetical protein
VRSNLSKLFQTPASGIGLHRDQYSPAVRLKTGAICSRMLAARSARRVFRPTGLADPPIRQPCAFDCPTASLIRFFSASVLNRWFRRSRRLSLPAMRSHQAQAVSGVRPANELPQQTRAGQVNWLRIILAATGITLVSSVAGVVVYDWFVDSVLVGLSSSLQPISDAFHQLGGSHLRQASPPPAN